MVDEPDEQSPPPLSAQPPAPRGRFPLLAVVHLTTVLALLCSCMDPRRFREASRVVGGDADAVAAFVALVVLTALAGAVIGGLVGLASSFRVFSTLIGAGVGVVAAVGALALIVSAAPGRLLLAAPMVLLFTMLLRSRHP